MEEATALQTVTPKELAAKMGVSPKRARMYLRTHYPRDVKHKSWQLTLEEAKVLIEQWRREYNQVRPHSARNY